MAIDAHAAWQRPDVYREATKLLQVECERLLVLGVEVRLLGVPVLSSFVFESLVEHAVAEHLVVRATVERQVEVPGGVDPLGGSHLRGRHL